MKAVIEIEKDNVIECKEVYGVQYHGDYAITFYSEEVIKKGISYTKKMFDFLPTEYNSKKEECISYHKDEDKINYIKGKNTVTVTVLPQHISKIEFIDIYGDILHKDYFKNIFED